MNVGNFIRKGCGNFLNRGFLVVSFGFVWTTPNRIFLLESSSGFRGKRTGFFHDFLKVEPRKSSTQLCQNLSILVGRIFPAGELPV